MKRAWNCVSLEAIQSMGGSTWSPKSQTHFFSNFCATRIRASLGAQKLKRPQARLFQILQQTKTTKLFSTESPLLIQTSSARYDPGGKMDKVWGCHRTSIKLPSNPKMKHIGTWNAPSTWAIHMAVGQTFLKCPGEQKHRQPTNWECCPQTKAYLTKLSTFILLYPD